MRDSTGRHVDPGTVGVWRWQTALTSLVFALPLVAVMLRAPAPIWWLLPALYAIVVLSCVWLIPPARYRALEFGVDEQGIRIQRGIFWKSRVALPRVRVQHSDVSQGPLQRRYGVATLKLYTAGSHYTKIELPGLAHEDALALRDELIAGGGDSGV